ncbi:cysteine synthase A [uncultured Faecalicoccus sp.]|uniref:cysteine synthase A n=1 Tax=uncultured Faecalicoccus sp. TaxID=1971760 RepID=UPI0025FE192D|nr:cysteine synthase A [uncultured Faecalicoccus sp.]
MEIKKWMDCIGNTPIVELSRIEQEENSLAQIYAKIEAMNPTGSAKDRIAKKMIEEAENKGLLQEGATIIEPTSGNTGIGLAMICAIRGYHAIFTMPETMSLERQKLLKAYGAKIVLTPAAQGMSGAIEKANQLHEEIPRSWIPSQFSNPDNPKAHYETTGPEIWNQMEGQVDVFVAGVGTGGTITGTGRYLKEKNPQVKVVAVEPATSHVLSGGKPGSHDLQGIGAGFIPDALDCSIYDQVICVENEQAYEMARQCAQKEGILVGISSGAALYAAVQLSKQKEYEGKSIVVLLPDTGERYLSTALWNE